MSLTIRLTGTGGAPAAAPAPTTRIAVAPVARR